MRKHEMNTVANFSYQSSATAVVFGGHLSAQARVHRDNPPLHVAPTLPEY